MANPRNVIFHDGIGYRALTMKVDGVTISAYSDQVANGSASAGLAVGLVNGSADTVQLVSDGEAVFGRLDRVDADGFCTVQIEGQCYLPAGASATLVDGSKIVGAVGAASAKGYIRSAAAPAGTYAQAAATDGANGKHSIIDKTTATRVSVMLGQA